MESLPFQEFSLHLGCWCLTGFLLVQLSCLFPDWVAALLELAAASARWPEFLPFPFTYLLQHLVAVLLEVAAVWVPWLRRSLVPVFPAAQAGHRALLSRAFQASEPAPAQEDLLWTANLSEETCQRRLTSVSSMSVTTSRTSGSASAGAAIPGFDGDMARLAHQRTSDSSLGVESHDFKCGHSREVQVQEERYAHEVVAQGDFHDERAIYAGRGTLATCASRQSSRSTLPTSCASATRSPKRGGKHERNGGCRSLRRSRSAASANPFVLGFTVGLVLSPTPRPPVFGRTSRSSAVTN